VSGFIPINPVRCLLSNGVKGYTTVRINNFWMIWEELNYYMDSISRWNDRPGVSELALTIKIDLL